MPSKVHVSDELALPIDWMTLATVVYGARGSGKTTLGSVFAEEIDKAKQRFCAIDLKGDWWGLKSTVDGKGAAIPVVIFGGDHADLPLEAEAGAFIAETVAGLEQSCILDLEHLSKTKQVRFLAAFFSRLYDKNRAPLLLLLDEAQRYAPQRPFDPDSAKCLGAVEDLVKLGRKHGIGPVLFTQRGAGLNKEVSEVCDLLVAFRTPGPLDQERIKAWLDANATKAQRDEVMGQLASLPTGTAVFGSGHPDLKVFGVHRVRRRETFDSSSTPKVGERRKEPAKLASADLTTLRARMADAIERVKADNPAELRRQKSELEAELRKLKAAPPAAAPKAEIKRVDVPAISAKERANLQRIADQIVRDVSIMEVALKKAADRLDGACEAALAAHGDAKDAYETAARELATKLKAGLDLAARIQGLLTPEVTHAPKSGATPAAAVRVEAGAGDTTINGGLRKLMIALAQRPDGLTNKQIGVRARVSHKTGTFATYLGQARAAGWIEPAGDRKRITDVGLKALGSYDLLPIGDELYQWWLRTVNGTEAKILKALHDAFPKSLTNTEIGERCGISHKTGTFATAKARLKSLDLMMGERDAFIASAELFP